MPRTATVPWTHEWTDHRWDGPAWMHDWRLWPGPEFRWYRARHGVVEEERSENTADGEGQGARAARSSSR